RLRGVTPQRPPPPLFRAAEPPPFSEPLAVPAALEHVVRHCLEKEPSARFQSASDLAFALDAPSSGTMFPPGAETTTSSAWTRSLLAGAGVVALAAAAGLGALLASRAKPPEPPPEMRIHRFTELPGLE